MSNIRKANSRISYTEILKLVKKTSVNYKIVDTFFKLVKESVFTRFDDFGARVKPKNWIINL